VVPQADAEVEEPATSAYFNSLWEDRAVFVDRRQSLRVLEGRFVLYRGTGARGVASDGGMLAQVFGPDGGARMRRDDTAEDAWVALWNGDEAHDPESTGMLNAIVAPLAVAELPVWVASSFDGDLVLVPVARMDEALGVLREAGHRVAG
jgi:hypothetical protein